MAYAIPSRHTALVEQATLLLAGEYESIVMASRAMVVTTRHITRRHWAMSHCSRYLLSETAKRQAGYVIEEYLAIVRLTIQRLLWR